MNPKSEAQSGFEQKPGSHKREKRREQKEHRGTEKTNNRKRFENFAAFEQSFKEKKRKPDNQPSEHNQTEIQKNSDLSDQKSYSETMTNTPFASLLKDMSGRKAPEKKGATTSTKKKKANKKPETSPPEVLGTQTEDTPRTHTEEMPNNPFASLLKDVKGRPDKKEAPPEPKHKTRPTIGAKKTTNKPFSKNTTQEIKEDQVAIKKNTPKNEAPHSLKDSETLDNQNKKNSIKPVEEIPQEAAPSSAENTRDTFETEEFKDAREQFEDALLDSEPDIDKETIEEYRNDPEKSVVLDGLIAGYKEGLDLYDIVEEFKIDLKTLQKILTFSKEEGLEAEIPEEIANIDIADIQERIGLYKDRIKELSDFTKGLLEIDASAFSDEKQDDAAFYTLIMEDLTNQAQELLNKSERVFEALEDVTAGDIDEYLDDIALIEEAISPHTYSPSLSDSSLGSSSQDQRAQGKKKKGSIFDRIIDTYLKYIGFDQKNPLSGATP
jgi:hypothetical protein